MISLIIQILHLVEQISIFVHQESSLLKLYSHSLWFYLLVFHFQLKYFSMNRGLFVEYYWFVESVLEHTWMMWDDHQLRKDWLKYFHQVQLEFADDRVIEEIREIFEYVRVIVDQSEREFDIRKMETNEWFDLWIQWLMSDFFGLMKTFEKLCIGISRLSHRSIMCICQLFGFLYWLFRSICI